METSREEAKEYITKQFKKKLKKEVFEKNLEGLIDEYLEVQKFIIDNGADHNELPTKKDMEYWFKDPVDLKFLEKVAKSGDGVCEIKIDDIYLNDPYFAKPIYKSLYNWKWENGLKIPNVIKELIILYKSMNKLETKQRKPIEIRIFNLAILGAVRFYHMERQPYFTGEEIAKIIQHFKMVLEVIYKIEEGFYGSSHKINGHVYLFDALSEKTTTTKSKVRKPRKKKDAPPNDRPDPT